MAMRTARTARLQVEGLERRETPSGGLGGAASALHASVARHPGVVHSVTIRGSGKATPTGPTIDLVTGRATLIGPFTGSINLVSNAVVFTANNGSHLNLKLGTLSHVKNRLHASFAITGGTGLFGTATGSGNLNGTVAKTGVISFQFNGKVTR